MEYKTNESKFRTKDWVEINDDSKSNSNSCNYNNAFILAKKSMAIAGEGADATLRKADSTNKEVIFKNRAPFTAV